MREIEIQELHDNTESAYADFAEYISAMIDLLGAQIHFRSKGTDDFLPLSLGLEFLNKVIYQECVAFKGQVIGFFQEM